MDRARAGFEQDRQAERARHALWLLRAWLAWAGVDVVLVAPWNRALLGPEWISSRVLVGEQPQVELILMGAPLGFRYRTKLVDLTVTEASLVITQIEDTPESLARTERVAVTLLEKLPETPVSAFGVDVTFDVTGDPAVDKEFHSLAASAKSLTGATLVAQRIQESFRLQNHVVHVTLVRELETGHTSLEFNHHHDLPPPTWEPPLW